MIFPVRGVIRRADGLYALERALRRRGFSVIAGADEAGRGACAGPLVAASVILGAAEIPGLADSKLLSATARERVFDEIMSRSVAHSVVVVDAAEVDRYGLHVSNLAALRRAVAGLGASPEYVLTDGFGVGGLSAPGLAIWKGDQVAACVAAASVLAKVTRDRVMVDVDVRYPEYGFGVHKGYVTAAHTAALELHGPCPQHRFSYANVARVVGKGTYAA